MKYAIIATGFIAHNHAVELEKMPDVELVGVVDTNEQAGTAFAQKYNTKFYPTVEALFEHERVEVADLCLPTSLHEEYTVKCAERGAHVLTEKPFSLSSASCERMKAACEQYGVRLMVAQVLRFWPEYLLLRDEIASGRLGAPELVHLSRMAAFPRWSTFYDTPSMSGGGVYDMHLHDVDIACHFFGDVERVYSIGYKNAKGAWNNVVSSLSFANGTQASVTACEQMSDNYPFRMDFRYLGRNGCIEFNYVEGELLRSEAQKTITRYLNGGSPEKLPIPEGSAYYNEIRYFLDRVQDGKPFDTVPVDDSIRSIKVIEAIVKSLETGEAVRL